MPDENEGEIPAAAGSALQDLRERRERAKRNLHLDLRVPRLEPAVYVRYGPLPKPVMDKANKQIFDSKDDDREVIAKAVVLTHVCLGVFTEDADGRPDGDPSTWPKFDSTLASILGIEQGGAVDVVRGLYLTDGDILAAVAELAEWSAQAERRQQEEHEGN